MKPYLKYIIRKLQFTRWLDSCVFVITKFSNRKKNHRYKKKNPDILLPNDYDLYETYQLDYQKFIEDGKLAATEILEWTKPYFNTNQLAILDWGCGVGRIARYIKGQNHKANLFACDIDQQKIEWNKKHYTDIDFLLVSYSPPTGYAIEQFDLIYGISIFSHIDSQQQEAWLQELQRMIKPNGILLITTQGGLYQNKLSSFEKKILNRYGIYTQSYPQQGHRMMSTYHQSNHFKEMIDPYFIVKEFYDGASYPEKIGGQDLWILQKK